MAMMLVPKGEHIKNLRERAQGSGPTSPLIRRSTTSASLHMRLRTCVQKRAKFGLALPALPGGEQRGAALARKIRAVCFEAFDDPAASGLYPAAIGPKIRPAGAAQQHRLLPRRQRWRNSIGRGHGCRRRLRRRGRRRLRVLSRGDRAGDRRDRLPASGRKALCVLLEAFQRCGAARRHARAITPVIGRAGLAHRADLRLGGLLGEPGSSRNKKGKPKGYERGEPRSPQSIHSGISPRLRTAMFRTPRYCLAAPKDQRFSAHA